MISYDELKKKVNSLNYQQRIFFDDFNNRIISDKEQFFAFISGDAGTGNNIGLSSAQQYKKIVTAGFVFTFLFGKS